MGSVLVAVNSCHVSSYNKRLFDITLMFWPLHDHESSIIESSIILYNKFPLTMIDDVCICGGQTTNVKLLFIVSNNISAINRHQHGIHPLVNHMHNTYALI